MILIRISYGIMESKYCLDNTFPQGKVLRFEMHNCKPRSTPSEQKFECNTEEPVNPTKYREDVGSLVYAMVCTRPDLL